MKKFTKSILVTAFALLALPLTGMAQTVVKLNQDKKAAPASALENPAKQSATKKEHVDMSSKFRRAGSLYTNSDVAAYENYTEQTGSEPASRRQNAPMKNPYEPDDETVYTYCGYNGAAGLSEDGTTSQGGMVAFNVNPFACDTISSASGVSPYSYVQGNKLYCFVPNDFSYDGTNQYYGSIIRSIFDANTMDLIEQKTFSNPTKAEDRMPYLISYDKYRDVVYVISLHNDDEATGDDTSYYLNILDTATCSLKRIGYIGGWKSARDKGNFSPKGFVATSGTLYIQNKDDSIYIETLNPQTLVRTVTGRTEIPTQYTYGLQPMYYDGNMGSLYVMHYDFNYGTQWYKVSPWVAYGATDNVLKTELIESLPTGYTFFYKRPETEFTASQPTLASISDLSVEVAEGSNTATVSFTVPTTYNDGTEIEFPSYASDKLRCYVYVDNNYVSASGLPSNVSYGESVSCTVDLTDGMHIVTALLYPMWYELNSSRTSTTAWVGYDAPAAVSNATLSFKDGVAQISWDAPTEGKYADFDSKFDASDLTYTVTRLFDGKVVAEDIAATSCTDSDISDEMHTYRYAITAKSHGHEGLEAKTNSLTEGKYIPLPYDNEFSEESCLDGFTVINADNNGMYRTWRWNYYYYYVTSGWGIADDWLITPPLKMSSDKLYSFAYDVEGQGKLYTTIGQDATVEGQDNELDMIEFDEFTKWITKEYYYHPTADGTYYFGLHSYSGGEEDGWYVDNMAIREIASTSAPDKVRSLTLTPDANGALGATLSFTLPATDIAGNSLSSLSKVSVYDMEGNLLASSSSVAPGEKTSIAVSASHGYNYFKVVAANAEGEGWPVNIRQFIGPDTPKAPTNVKAKWGEDRTIASLSWEISTEGVNGGYVDPEDVTYKIYKYTNSWPLYSELGEIGNDNSVDVEILDATETQDQYIFGLTASNSEGESDYSRVGLVMGEPYSLPIEEPFAATGLNYAPWMIMTGKNKQAWTIDEGYYNDKIQPQNDDQLQLVFINTGTEDGSSRFITPIIDFSSAKNPMMSVWLHHSDAMPEGAYVTVDATLDGSSDYIAVSDTTHLTGNNGWTQHFFALKGVAGNKAQIGLDAYLPNPSFRIFTDNWKIYEAAGNDLALTSISQPYCPVVGDTAKIAVTVANLGAQSASDYSVIFTLNGEAIAEEEAAEALEMGGSAVFNFSFPITAATKEYIYSAELMYDGDENEDNNYSTEVELAPTQIELPAPTDLTLSGDEDLSWLAPETMDGREVVLDFENLPAFTVDEINGWNTVDGDGHLTTTFVQYYSNYWPYANQPQSWMTWSALEAGCPSAAMWCPYEGEKCLIAWGNYGADAEGHTVSDPDDDWFISPEVKPSTEFSFMTLTNDATSSIEVLTSSTTRDPEAFTNRLTTVTYSNISEWYEVKTTLPADAKYVAIHTVLNGFGIMVDNVKYTEAKAPELLGYSLYCDGESQDFLSATSAKAQGNGSYAVSAIYDLGESELSDAVSVTNAISELGAIKAVVRGGYHTISIAGAAGQKVEIFAAGGQKMASTIAAEKETVSVPAGIYIAKVGGKAYKVSVK